MAATLLEIYFNIMDPLPFFFGKIIMDVVPWIFNLQKTHFSQLSDCSNASTTRSRKMIAWSTPAATTRWTRPKSASSSSTLITGRDSPPFSSSPSSWYQITNTFCLLMILTENYPLVNDHNLWFTSMIHSNLIHNKSTVNILYVISDNVIISLM